MPPSSDGAQTEILCPSEKTEAYRPEWAQIPPRPARSRWRCKLGRNRWTIWPQLCGSQLPACNIISVMVILPWNTAEEHEQHKGGRTWLSLLLSSRSTMHGHLEPSSSATGVRCLAALVMMRRPTRLPPERHQENGHRQTIRSGDDCQWLAHLCSESLCVVELYYR